MPSGPRRSNPGRTRWRTDSRLRFPDGDDVGSIETGEANWQPGDTLIGHGNTHYRITAVIPIERVEEFIEKPIAGVLEVEPL